MLKTLTLIVTLISVIASSAATAQVILSPDAKTLKALADAGSDLAKPHEINHWLYFSDEASARAAADELASTGFTVDSVEKRPDANQWRVLALKTVIPSLSVVEDTSAFLEELAQRHHGEYDGWETQVVPR